MEEQLVEFDTAKLAKEKGFNVEVPKGYYKHGDARLVLWIDSENYNNQEDFVCLAPTQSLLQKWLREEHKINVESNYLPNIQKYGYLFVPMTKSIPNKEKYALRSKYYGVDKLNTYEEALEKGLQEALKLI